MFEVAESFLIQLIECIPVLLGIYWIFDLLGGLFFNKK